ncbi:MAG: hypothetical protein J7M12_03295 [Candidatus Hydrogenedentes bacterium]|nr:hypothetical protein [Candidatus Hydrogenedentota bacterium]
MTIQYDPEQIKRLECVVDEARLYHGHSPKRYEPGHVFDIEVTGVCPAVTGRAKLVVEKFIGGGFAGQVYRTKLLSLDLDGQTIPGLEVGGVYAVKIIIPPSEFSQKFRNAVYWLAYQGPFAAQVNRAAARTGVLWQKLIRRGAAVRFGDERAVADTYATFFDSGLGSYGEINEWIDGRIWRFEVDDRICRRGKENDTCKVLSAEYLAKKKFMADLVELFHDMGAPELARQYEWWTCKSQPNVLKRTDAGDGPADGLTAFDFRAGLALLPFLPMSPADVPLIIKGLARGALVQFDRGDIGKLDAFCKSHAAEFRDLQPAIDELHKVDPEYRASLPDITHHGFRLLYDKSLRKSVKKGLVEGWRVKGYVDDDHAAILNNTFFRFWLFWLLGFVPFLGKYARLLWGKTSFIRHFKAFFTSFDYMRRTFRARLAEHLIDWYRLGKVDERGIEYFLKHPSMFWLERVVPGILPIPAKWHRFLVDWRFAGRTVAGAVYYAVKFYRDAEFRVAWLTSEVESGAAEGMLTEQEKNHIIERVPDPFIQKYLKCVAVHLCTLPVTQIVSVTAGTVAYYYTYHVMGWDAAKSAALSAAIIVGAQVMPISPGSICRGAYVLYLMIRERNIKNYWLAAPLSFVKYIGYLSFPIQMVKEFPAFSRFMAGRWATKMVAFIPVFGERGALLEHTVFDVFFNVPISIKRYFSRSA